MFDDATDSRAGTTIDLACLRRALRAARVRILLAAGVVAVVAALAVGPSSAPSSIEIGVRIEPRSHSDVVPGDEDRRDDALVATQLELLGSDRILRAVAEAAPEDVVALEGEGRAEGVADRGTTTPKERRLAVLRERLSAERVDRSREIRVRARAEDAEAGERVLAAVLRHWAAAVEEDRERAVVEAAAAGTAEIEAARRRLDVARAEAATPTASADPEIVTLRSEHELAAARLKRLQVFAAAGPSGAERAVDEASTPVLRELRERRAALRSRAAQLSTVYLANHPLMKELDADLADLRRRIASELPRALAAARAGLAALERRIAEAEARSTETSEAATAALEAMKADLAVAQDRREASLARARAETGVDLLRTDATAPEQAPSLVRALAAALLAAGATMLAALVVIARGAVVKTRIETPLVDVEIDEPPPAETFAPQEFAEPAEPTRPIEPLAPVAAAAPMAHAPVVSAPETPAPLDREAPARAERFRAAAAELVDGLAARLLEETGSPCRIVVASTRDAAWAHGASLALAEACADGALSVGRVALDDVDPSRDAGLSDVLDGRVAFSAAIGRDRATGVWTLTRGHRRIEEADRADPGLDSLLEALDATWDVVIVSVGRLDGGAGTARLLETADAVVVAEDVAVEERTVAVVEALNEAGRPTWILDAPVETVATARDWARAA